MLLNRFAASLLLAASCFVAILAVANSANAQKGTTANLPPAQKEIVDQVVTFAKQYHEAAKLKNKVARQDALKEHDAKLKAWLDQTNKQLAKGAIKEWVGNALVTTQTVTLENRVFLEGGESGTFTSVKVSFPAAGLSPAIREQVGKLKKNEVAKVTFANESTESIIFSKSSLTGISAQLKSPKSVASVSSAGQ